MSPKKKPSDAGAATLAHPRARFALGSRGLAIGGILVALGAALSYAVWQQVGEHVLAGEQYQVAPEQITISPPPPWIRSDIKAEVLRDNSFEGGLSLLDPDLTVRMAAAFAAHPWVARVQRVSKQYPAALQVLLVYRKPVALVEVQEATGALPVDIDGVVLPTQDFTATDAETYPRIGEIPTTHSGRVGTPWGDARVVGAAQVAAVLADHWKQLDLFRIVPHERKAARAGIEYTYTLITHSGTQILWGRAPSTDVPGEVPAAEKISQLKRYAEQNRGSLDDPDGQPHQIVINDKGALLSNPRPNVTPLPKSGE